MRALSDQMEPQPNRDAAAAALASENHELQAALRIWKRSAEEWRERAYFAEAEVRELKRGWHEEVARTDRYRAEVALLKEQHADLIDAAQASEAAHAAEVARLRADFNDAVLHLNNWKRMALAKGGGGE